MENAKYYNNFLDVFNKITFPKNVISNFKTTHISSININKGTKSMEINMQLMKVINEKYVNDILTILRKEFPYIKDIKINLRYNLLENDLATKIENYWINILNMVYEGSPVCHSILKESTWYVKDNKFIIKTINNGSFLFIKRGFDKKIQYILKNNLNLNLLVLFTDEKSENFKKEAYLNYLAKEENQIINQFVNDSVSSNNITQSKPTPITSQSKKRVKNKVKINNNITGDIVKLDEPLNVDNEITFKGIIFDTDLRETKSGLYIISFDITDGTSSITVKFFIHPQNYNDDYKSLIKKDNHVIVRGKVQFDKFANEVNVMAQEIGCAGTLEERMDTLEEKRVELHLHTQMSAMDGITSINKYINRAKKWGHKAIAITDHGVVQAFPEAMSAAKNSGVKIIYGLEAYLVDDLGAVVQSPRAQTFDDEFIVFDIETTGLHKETNYIIEIGAIKIKNGKVIDTFSSLIDPKMKLPSKIIQITNITDDMLRGQPEEKDVIPKFIDFIGDSVLVAHNSSFDVGFIRVAAKRILKKEVNNTVLDTVELSRTLFPELSRHKLNIVAKHLGISLENHHRAVDDAKATADIFLKCVDILKQKNIYNLQGINQLASQFIDKSKLKTHHAVILVKNYTGLRNLYELISNSHIKYYYRRPRIPKSEYLRLKEGLLIGTACNAGEFYKAVHENKPEDYIRELAEFYDYFEVQPIDNNMYMLRDGLVSSVQELIDINKKIINLGEKYNKLVVAAGDVHFLDPKDEIYRRILMAGEGFKDADIQPPLYYRTTEEMLNEFDYLGKEKALEIVVKNTNKIADMIEGILPIPNGTFTPKIEGAEEELTNITMNKAKEIYGEELPLIVAERLERELNSIIKNGFAVMYVIAQKLVWKSLEEGYLVGSRGSVGSSFVATMAEITEVNPLPAHYVCPNCKTSDFNSDNVKKFLLENPGGSGCDMPNKLCDKCNIPMNKDGHDIPFETFLGFDGDKEPDIDLNFSGEYQTKAHAYTEELFGEGHVFKAGTIGTLADKTAYGYTRKYMEERNLKLRNAEVNRIKKGCTGIKRTTGQHPGGLMIVPSGHSIYEFCPVQRPANDTKSNVTTTHFDYHSISGRLLKLDILGHDVPTIIRMLHDTTGKNPQDIDLGDKKVISLFTSPKALGVLPEDIDCKTGSLGLPEFGTSFVRQMLIDTNPTSFGELVRISGLSHGTDVWFNNAQELIKNNICTLKDVIPTRDDIMVYLIAHGVDKMKSFTIMESVRKGKGLSNEDEEVMLKNNVPQWYIDSCKKIKYMFPKGHAVAYVMMTVRIGYFKIYYPYSFYGAIFSVKSEDFDYETMCKGRDKVKQAIVRIKSLGNDATTKEKATLTTLELVNEMYARGLKFLPLNMYEANATKFKVLPNGIMPPLSSIQGLGDTVALNIVEARKNGEFATIEEFRERTKATKTVIELLKQNNILDGIPETNQLSLF